MPSLVRIVSANQRPSLHSYRGGGGQHCSRTLDIAPGGSQPESLPVTAAREQADRPPTSAAAPPHGTRRGRRVPSARRRGRRAQRWFGNQPTVFLIGHLNIQSLKPKILDLPAELDKFKYDLFSLNESWLRPDTPSRLLVAPGYQLLRADRPDQGNRTTGTPARGKRPFL